MPIKFYNNAAARKEARAIVNGLVQFGHRRAWEQADLIRLELTCRSLEYEMHFDSKVCSCAAGAELEVDILVIGRDIADDCRRKRRGSLHSEMKLMVEAKFHHQGVGMNEAKLYTGMCFCLRTAPCAEAIVTCGGVTAEAEKLLKNLPTPPGPATLFEKVLPANTAEATAFVGGLLKALDAVL